MSSSTSTAPLARDTAASFPNHEPIAIVGIGCRFPGGAHDPDGFWRMLCEGVDAVVEVPADRFSAARFCDTRQGKPGKTVSRWGGFVRQRVEELDAAFFGMSPREAAHLDPMQRWLLEVSWEALEDAGLVPERLAGSKTAVFVGGFTEDIKLLQMDSSNRALIGPHAATGSAMTMLSNRLSHFFDFRGPSVALDTACSSSLVAVHLACQSIWNGESTLALAGGANAMFRPEYTIAESTAGMLSPDGRSKAFDSRANGYVRGEGAAIVVLKPLSAAQRDGDPVYAVIRGTAVNQDGRTNGITVPNGDAQVALIREVGERARVSLADIHYVEAHGTGTPVGDPIEANALGRALGAGRSPDAPCVVGSVKTNMGHLEAAAGVAGLIKTALILRHGAIPPHLHLERLNPSIDLAKLTLRIPTALEPWPAERPRLASVNSFGFGGTNAHVILEGPAPVGPSEPGQGCNESEPLLFPFSARSEGALRELARRHRARLDGAPGAANALVDLSYTLGARRSHHEHRLALRATSVEALKVALDAYLAGSPAPGMFSGRAPKSPPRPVFVLSGMGPQWWGMARELLEDAPVFRRALEDIDRRFAALAQWSLIDALLADEATSRMRETQVAQPASFALQVGLVALFRSWGIEPSAIVGHSAGEVAAAYAAGVYDLDDAVTIIYHRSRLQHRTTGQGKLVAVGLPLLEARTRIERHGGQISIAAVNSPEAVTLVGEADTLEDFVAPLREQNVFVRFLKVDVPYHSHYMDPLRPELEAALASIRPGPARIPLVSTVTGAHSPGTEWNARYWWRNVRDSVLFAAGVEALLDAGYDTFVELSPHPVLGSSIRETFARRGRQAAVVSTLRRDGKQRETLLGCVAELYALGVTADFDALRPPHARPARLPSYPWQREEHWIESAASRRDRLGSDAHELLGDRLACAEPQWERTLDAETLPYLADHVVQGNVVFPGAGYIEMMLAASGELFGAERAFELTQVEFQRALFLRPDSTEDVQLSCDPGRGALRIASRASGAESAWTVHASGVVRPLPGRPPTPVHVFHRAAPASEPIDDCYAFLATMDLEYGPRFRTIRHLNRHGAVAVARVALGEEAPAHRLHPALLDGCFQVILATLAQRNEAGGAGPHVYLPTSIASLRIHGRAPDELWVRVELREENEREVRADLVACDVEGRTVVEARDIVARAVERAAPDEAVRLESLFYGVQWRRTTDAVPERVLPLRESGRWLLISDDAASAEALVAALAARGDAATLVSYGSTYSSNADRSSFTLDPAAPDHFARLVAEAFAGASYRGIVLCVGWDRPSSEELTRGDLERAQQHGPIALLHLLQALEASGKRALPRVWGVTRGAQSVFGEAQPGVADAALWGMLRVVAYQEHPERFGGAIDLDPARPPGELEQLARDLVAGELTDAVAYRGGERYAPRFTPQPELLAPAPRIAFRADASYLVTGGLGGLGLTVARYLAQRGARRLILLGRTPLPPRSEWRQLAPDTPLGKRTAALLELERMGTSVVVASLDVSDEAALAAFLNEHDQAGWAPIRGVIHAAGVSEPRLMMQLTQDVYRQTIRPKVQGAWALHRSFEDKDLDFFLLFSSVAAFAFTAGQADYASANAFLDGLAHYRRARGLTATSINFGPWAEAGMATLLGDYFVERGMTPFAPKKGLDAIEQLLQRDVAQATVLWISDRRAFRERNFSSSAQIPFLDPLLEASPPGAPSDTQASDAPDSAAAVLAALREAGSSDHRADVLAGYLQKLIGRTLRLGGAAVPTDTRLGDLGLDSLLAVEVKSRLTHELGVVVSVMDLLKGITIVELARAVGAELDLAERPALPERPADAPLVADDVPLAPNQRWFLSRNLPNPHHWNMAALWQASEPLDRELLAQALRAVLVHHDALRARFIPSEGGIRQNIVAPAHTLPLHVYDLSAFDLDAQTAAVEVAIARLQTELHLEHGPLVRVASFEFGEKQKPCLLVILHHLVSDVFSQKVVLSDLETAYRQLQSGRPVRLPEKGASVIDWVQSLQRYVRSEASSEQRAYYRARRWAAPAPFPVDFPKRRVENTIGSARVLVSSLPEEESRRITNNLAERGTRLPNALLTAFAVAVTEFSRRPSLLADIIVHGRESPGADLDLARTVGLFAHGVPLEIELPSSRDLDASLRAVEKSARVLANHGRSYAALRWLSDDTELSQRIPRRELVFNYIGHFEPADTDNVLFSVLPRVPGFLEPADNPRDFVLQCQVGVLNGRLTVLWNYSENLHRRDTIERLGQTFLKALQGLASGATSGLKRPLASQA